MVREIRTYSAHHSEYIQWQQTMTQTDRKVRASEAAEADPVQELEEQSTHRGFAYHLYSLLAYRSHRLMAQLSLVFLQLHSALLSLTYSYATREANPGPNVFPARHSSRCASVTVASRTCALPRSFTHCTSPQLRWVWTANISAAAIEHEPERGCVRLRDSLTPQTFVTSE